MKLLAVFTVALAAVTFLGWFGRFNPWLELLTNAAPQLWFLGLVLVLWAAMARQPVPAAVGVLVVVWFSAVMAPFWFATGRTEVGTETRYTALQYNVYFGNENTDRIVAEIEAADADIIAVHEITTSQWETLRSELGDHRYTLAEPWDGSDQHQLGGGMALLSRTPLEPLDLDRTADVTGRPIIAAVTTLDDHKVVVVGLHPHASRFERHKVDLRNLQLRAVADLLAEDDRPAIVLTDLNLTPTSPDYQRFVDDLQWDDPHRTVGWKASWPSWAGPLGMPIDHVLVSDQIVLHEMTTGNGGGSDHRSVTATFSIAE